MELLQPIANVWAVWVIAWYLVKNQTKQNNIFIKNMGDIANSIKKIASNVWKTLLDWSQSKILFESVLHIHVDKQCEYVSDIIKNNDLSKREENIKKNIKNEFTSITQEWARKLSLFNSPAGDLWNILLREVDLDKYFSDIYIIVFGEWTASAKRKDLRSLMHGEVNSLLSIIDKRVRDNTL